MTMTAEKLDYHVAAMFFTGEKIDQAIKALSEIGIAKDQISLLCTEQAVKDASRREEVAESLSNVSEIKVRVLQQS